MWNKKSTKLSRELLTIFLLDLAISIFTVFFLNLIGKGLLFSFCDNKGIVLSEIQEYNYLILIGAASIALAATVFIIIFLLLVGQKLYYLKEITAGINALTDHRLNYEIPVRDDNEFTQLAIAINYMSKTELALKEKERKLALEKEDFIRVMSHDIRTPLTSILAHTEFLNSKDSISPKEIKEYLDIVGRKSNQIKELSDMLLDANNTNTQHIPDGRLLFVQLADEWLESLEDTFSCKVSVCNSINFNGDYRVQEFQRIFDNLSSNIKKYADATREVSLDITEKDHRLTIVQSNYKARNISNVESFKIGIDSIRRIAQHYEGSVTIDETEEVFTITITLFSI